MINQPLVNKTTAKILLITLVVVAMIIGLI